MQVVACSLDQSAVTGSAVTPTPAMFDNETSSGRQSLVVFRKSTKPAPSFAFGLIDSMVLRFDARDLAHKYFLCLRRTILTSSKNNTKGPGSPLPSSAALSDPLYDSSSS